MQRFILIAFFFFLSLFFLHPINAGDFFHHLNTGRYLLTHYKLPYTDEWSFTAYGQPWVAYSWGSGVVFYLLYRLSGFASVSWFLGFLGGLTGFFLYKLLRQLSVSSRVSLIMVALALAVASLRSPTRPEAFAPFLLVLLLYLLSSYSTSTGSNLWWLVLFPVFFWFWAIFYGSSTILGIGILLLFFIFLARRKSPKELVTVILLCLLATLLNGYGLRSFLYIRQIPSIAPHTTEWLPILATLDPQFPDLVLKYQYDVLIYILLVIFYLLVLTLKVSRLFLFTLSLGIFLPLTNGRFLSLAAYIATPFMALSIQSASKKLRILFLILAAGLALSAMIVNLKKADFGWGLSTSIFPVEAVNYLKTHSLSTNIFAHQELAAFISWELPDAKIFVDTRDDLFQPLGVFRELEKFYQGQIAVLDASQTEVVLGEVESAQAYRPLIYNPNWRLVYLTDGYFVAIRTSLLSKYNLTHLAAIDPFRSPPAKPGKLVEAEREYINLLKNSPDSVGNSLRLIDTQLALNKAIEAKQKVDRLNLDSYRSKLNVIDQISILILRGRISLAANDCSYAYQYLKEADTLSRSQFFFYPAKRLSTSVDRYLGEYYLACENNAALAREYFTSYLPTVVSSVERREIEEKLEALR